MPAKVWTDNNGTEIRMEDPEAGEEVLLEFIIDIPMSVYVKPDTGEVQWAETWVDRRTPEEYDEGTKFSEYDKIKEAHDYFRAHMEEPDKEEE